MDQALGKLFHTSSALDKVADVFGVHDMASKEAMDLLVLVESLGVEDRRRHLGNEK